MYKIGTFIFNAKNEIICDIIKSRLLKCFKCKKSLTKIRLDLISKRWKSLIPENDYEFLVISQYLQISCAVDSSGIGYVLTEILQVDQKITFDIFHILN